MSSNVSSNAATYERIPELVSSNGGPTGIGSVSTMPGVELVCAAKMITPAAIGTMTNRATISEQPRATLRPAWLGLVVTPLPATVFLVLGGGP